MLPSKKEIRLIPEIRITVSPKLSLIQRVKRLKFSDFYGLLLILILACVGLPLATKNSPPEAGASSPEISEPRLRIIDNTPWGDEVRDLEPTSARKNDTAPVLTSKDEDTKAYIEKYAPVAIKEQAAFGVPASISLAQGLIESNAGKSRLAINANNHFGMKCFSRRCKKGHCINATDDTHKDFFLKFENVWSSYRKHSQLLSNRHYRSLHKYGKDYRKWAYGLKAKGYATDATYAEKLIGVIERYKLFKYDK